MSIHTHSLILAGLLALAGLAVGCTRSVQPAASDYFSPTNEVISAYGLTLDENASPEQTVWALLQAIHDDVNTPMSSPEWQELIKLQCRLANVELLRTRLEDNNQASRKKSEEMFFEVVKGWAAALNYYAEHFDDTLEQALHRMTVRELNDNKLPEQYRSVRVVDYVLTTGQPDSPPGLERGVDIRFFLAKTLKGYWRAYLLTLNPPPASSNS